MSLAPTPAGSLPSTVTRMFLAFFCVSVWVASTCSTSDVPMPCASAPKAPCVEVWLSPHTMVVPGSVKPCSGPDHVHDALPDVALVEVLDAEFLGVLGERLDLDAALLVLDALRCGRRVVAMLWSTTASVFSGARTLRLAMRRPSNACGLVTSCTRWRSM